MITHKGRNGIEPAIPVSVKLDRTNGMWVLPYTNEMVQNPTDALEQAKTLFVEKTLSDGYVRFPWLDTGEKFNPYVVDKVRVNLSDSLLKRCKLDTHRPHFLLRLFNTIFHVDPFREKVGFYTADSMLRGVPIKLYATSHSDETPDANMGWSTAVWGVLKNHKEAIIRKIRQDKREKTSTYATIAEQHRVEKRTMWGKYTLLPVLTESLTEDEYFNYNGTQFIQTVDLAIRLLQRCGDSGVLYRVSKGRRFGSSLVEKYVFNGVVFDDEPTYLEVYSEERPPSHTQSQLKSATKWHTEDLYETLTQNVSFESMWTDNMAEYTFNNDNPHFIADDLVIAGVDRETPIRFDFGTDRGLEPPEELEEGDEEV